jgi:hypothetical protein
VRVPKAEPRGHDVQFYDADAFPTGGVVELLGEALEAGGAAVAVASAAHLSAIEIGLSSRGVDIGAAASSGRLVLLDAQQSLAALNVDGAEMCFDFGSAASDRACRHSSLHVFYELVDLRPETGRERSAPGRL